MSSERTIPAKTCSIADPEVWQDILVALLDGDSKSLDRLWGTMGDFLRSSAEKGLGGQIRAKLNASDIVQQSLLDAYQGIRDFAGDSPEELRAWLLTIASHNLADAGRHYHSAQKRDISREVSLESIDSPAHLVGPGLTASVQMRQAEQDAELTDAISRLSPRQRRIIEMRHRQSMSYADISRSLSLSEDAARQLWKRAIVSLKVQLKATHDEQPRKPR